MSIVYGPLIAPAVLLFLVSYITALIIQTKKVSIVQTVSLPVWLDMMYPRWLDRLTLRIIVRAFAWAIHGAWSDASPPAYRACRDCERIDRF